MENEKRMCFTCKKELTEGVVFKIVSKLDDIVDKHFCSVECSQKYYSTTEEFKKHHKEPCILCISSKLCQNGSVTNELKNLAGKLTTSLKAEEEK